MDALWHSEPDESRSAPNIGGRRWPQFAIHRPLSQAPDKDIPFGRLADCSPASGDLDCSTVLSDAPAPRANGGNPDLSVTRERLCGRWPNAAGDQIGRQQRWPMIASMKAE